MSWDRKNNQVTATNLIDDTVTDINKTWSSQKIQQQINQSPSSTGNSNIYGLKWAALGDSITRGLGATTPYHTVIAQKHNMTVYNHGINATLIAVYPNKTNPMVERYVNMEDADIITVFGGTNDYASSVPLGDITSTDNTTFYGALNILCLGLIQKYPGKRIGFFTPMSRGDVNPTKMTTYVDAIKEVCGKHSIPVLDMFNSGGIYPVDSGINATFFYNSDKVHPNNEGHKIIARRIEHFIQSI